MRTGLGVTGALLGLALAGTAHLDREVDVAQGVSRAFEEVSERIAPSVVRIESATRLVGGVRPLGEGSGFVLDEAGLIVTNAHVVNGADAIRVQLIDGRALDAELVGKDIESDLAVLRVEAEGLVAAPLRRDEPARVGEWVIAVGNPLGLGHSVSAGIVSGRGRTANITTYEDFIQTDAAINPGNSGGPLVDLKGRIVGVNTAVADIRMGGQGIGFAIPASMVSEVTAQLARWGEVRRGYVGVNLGNSASERAGSTTGPEPGRGPERRPGGPAEAPGSSSATRGRVNDRWSRRSRASWRSSPPPRDRGPARCSDREEGGRGEARRASSTEVSEGLGPSPPPAGGGSPATSASARATARRASSAVFASRRSS